MKRLTKWVDGNVVPNHLLDEYGRVDFYVSEGELLKKLADYEDAEEQGRLVTFPIAIGDTAYMILGAREIDEYKVWGVAITEDGVYIVNSTIGMEKIGSEYALLTREKAEAGLAKMKGGAD